MTLCVAVPQCFRPVCFKQFSDLFPSRRSSNLDLADFFRADRKFLRDGTTFEPEGKEPGLRARNGKKDVATLAVRVPESGMAKAQSLVNRYDEGG